MDVPAGNFFSSWSAHALAQSPRTIDDEGAQHILAALWISTLKYSSHHEDDFINLAVWEALLKTHRILRVS